ncbi:hypothetical protein E2P65_05540 [Candidatus Bathyarchaeota archaeon]|nr:hypothetical protein E2P65_05540 [Candidatus Bathyarchaeota archaeon]
MQLLEWVLVFILIGPLILTVIVLGLSLAGVGIKDLSRYLSQLRAEEEPLPEDTIPDVDVDRYIEELKRQRDEG